MGLKPASVCPSIRTSVHPFTLSNMNIAKTGGPIAIKFYMKHHWGGGKAALGFGADQIRTLVSMATESSHRVIMGKRVSLFSTLFLIGSFSYYLMTMTYELGLWSLLPLSVRKTFHRLIMGKTTSSSFLSCF